MTNLLLKNAIWMALGVLLGVTGWHPWDSWQWWAWFILMMALVYARDEAMKTPNAIELTGAECVRVE